MRKTIQNSFLIYILLVSSFIIYGQQLPKEFNLKQLEKSIVKINDTIYASKYEVTNSDYWTFVHDLISRNEIELLNKAIPDSNIWYEQGTKGNSRPISRAYNTNQLFKENPVLGVSYEGANLYCKWLTELYNKNPKRKYKKVLFRLPTSKEWELAARGGEKYNTYPWGVKLKHKNKYMCNYLKLGDECILFDTLIKEFVAYYDYGCICTDTKEDLKDLFTLTVNVHSFHPNQFGLYNVCGNVAEMVQEKGIARGGGWRSSGGDVAIGSKMIYNHPTWDIGFRIFMEVIEE